MPQMTTFPSWHIDPPIGGVGTDQIGGAGMPPRDPNGLVFVVLAELLVLGLIGWTGYGAGYLTETLITIVAVYAIVHVVFCIQTLRRIKDERQRCDADYEEFLKCRDLENYLEARQAAVTKPEGFSIFAMMIASLRQQMIWTPNVQYRAMAGGAMTDLEAATARQHNAKERIGILGILGTLLGLAMGLAELGSIDLDEADSLADGVMRLIRGGAVAVGTSLTAYVGVIAVGRLTTVAEIECRDFDAQLRERFEGSVLPILRAIIREYHDAGCYDNYLIEQDQEKDNGDETN